MAYRWNKRSIEKDSIVNGRELDISINDFIDVMNNAIDRENIPLGYVSGSMVQDAEIAEYYEDKSVAINEGFCGKDLNFNSTTATHPKGNEIFGLRYTNSVNLRQGGNWIQATNASLSGQFKEGMLTVDWRCKSYIPKYRTFRAQSGTTVVAPKFAQWQVRYNGNVVYESGAMFEQWNNVHCSTTFPVATGQGQVDIYYLIPELIDDDANQVVFYFFGGQLTAMNRKR